jgi:hypothetical protein
MDQAGMNALIYPIRYFDDAVGDEVEKLRQEAELADRMGIRLLVSILYFVKDAGKDFESRKYVTSSGDERAAPCPLDWRYWKESILRQVRPLAGLAMDTPIAGLVLDTEMYTADRAHIYSRNGRYCDDCMEVFLRGKTLSAPQDRSQRMGWLEDQGLLEQYHDKLRERMGSVAERVRAEIREVNPDFLLGFLLYDHNWYYRALTEGWGTPEMPVLVFDESTYGQGWGPLADQMVQYFPIMGYEAFYFPGLWFTPLSPDRIESEAYYSGANADGYWIFPFDSIPADPGSLSADFVLNGSSQDYWRAISRANGEIGERLSQGVGYQSSIASVPKPDTFISFSLTPDEHSIRIVNQGFTPTKDLRVAVNGRFVTRVSSIGLKSSSEAIPYEPDFTGSSGVYGLQGLTSVAIMERDGTLRDLLGSTPPSVFE